MGIKPFFRWYDLWIGAYIDRENQTLYVCPLPMLGIKISLKRLTKREKRFLRCMDAVHEILNAPCDTPAIVKDLRDMRDYIAALIKNKSTTPTTKGDHVDTAH